MIRYRGIALAAMLFAAVPVWAADDAVIAQLNARLAALDNDPQLREQGAYERMQAMQAISRYADAKRSERDTALYVAQRRVEIAELAAKTAAANLQVNQLDQTRNALLLQASQRETARVRQEAERLRVQQQIQAEEEQREREQAEAEAAQQAEQAQQAQQAITAAAGAQKAKLLEARKKDASLARQEAEIVSGAKLPKSTFSANGAEIFTLPPSVFEPGKAALSASGKSAIKALVAYLDATKGAKMQVDGYDDKQTPGARRSAAIQAALVAGGAPQGRVRDGGSKGVATKSRAAVVTVTF